MTGKLQGELRLLRKLFGDLLLAIEHSNIPSDKEKYIKDKINKVNISTARGSAVAQKLINSTKTLQREYDELKRNQ